MHLVFGPPLVIFFIFTVILLYSFHVFEKSPQKVRGIIWQIVHISKTRIRGLIIIITITVFNIIIRHFAFN